MVRETTGPKQRGRPQPRVPKLRQGAVHKFWIPKSVLKNAQQGTPDTGGDKKWEGASDVVKGQWLHIADGSWKAGFQWCIKSAEIIHALTMEVKEPYEAADAWGRGRQAEFPMDFDVRPPDDRESASSLSRAGHDENDLEPSEAQQFGLSDPRSRQSKQK